MGEKYLIDTCAVIKYLDEIYPAEALKFIDGVVDDISRVSFITKIELLAWNPPVPKDIIIREKFLAGSEILFINDEIIEKAIRIRKETKIKLPDAIIAATAVTNELILLSDNVNDFKKVKSTQLKFINPKTAFRN